MREFGGLQSYPSRAKDPDPVDYSTGSVGIGATAPIWGAIARRYVDNAFGTGGTGRQYSLVGDAELDEGAVWEAVLDPAVSQLGEVVWIVDLNRQSLDRVVPNIAADKLQRMFDAAGWQVIVVKYGQAMEQLFARPGGCAVRRRIDEMANPEYQRLLRCNASELRHRLPGAGPDAGAIARVTAEVDDATLVQAIANLGGHDLSALDRALSTIDDSRPTVVFAYTVKGYGLATHGHPQNHSSLLTDDQVRELAVRLGADPDDPWRQFPDGSVEAELCRNTAKRLARSPIPVRSAPSLPSDIGRTPAGMATTQLR
ncbi:Pyruvate dehydrogenase E1 component [Mycobacterium talmoniae]|uniref:Pyruvate dehydrogenase E1 component n=1 Tax=Mycobacterium talmoniae TaxID=1858794 RepID=A0A2S8BMW6_9MYCO|nr:Pyruvate dehydrogenase E1 component [Mycobacterium talmoniae]